MTPDNMDTAGSTLHGLLRLQAASDPQRLAIAVRGSGSGAEVRLTVGEWAAHASRAASHLASLGIGRGDRIAVWGQNSAAWAVWLAAASRRGAALVALHPGMTVDELTAALKRSRPRWMFIDDVSRGASLRNMAQEATGLACDGSAGEGLIAGLRGVTTMAGGDGSPDYLSVISASLEGRDVVASATSNAAGAAPATPSRGPEHLHALEAELLAEPDDPLCLLFTSGSSGQPKLVSLSHRALLHNAGRTAKAAGIVRGDRIASPLPLYHAAGVSSGLVLSLVTEALWCSTGRFRSDVVMEQIKAHECTVVQGVPTMFRALMAEADKSGAPTSLRLGFIGGAAVALPLCEQAVAALGLGGMCAIYGQTEFGPTISATAPTEPGPRSRVDGGVPIEGTEVRIVDPSTAASTPTDVSEGEIWVRGDTAMIGYFEDEAATRAAVMQGGWVRTGDLGAVVQGRLQVIGRLKTLIIRGGENVSPSEIEDLLREAAHVADACVVPLPSEHWGEAICACVTPIAGQLADTSALKRWCDARLSRHKRPDMYMNFDEFPLLASGKVDRECVRHMAMEQALTASPNAMFGESPAAPARSNLAGQAAGRGIA